MFGYGNRLKTHIPKIPLYTTLFFGTRLGVSTQANSYKKSKTFLSPVVDYYL